MGDAAEFFYFKHLFSNLSQVEVQTTCYKTNFKHQYHYNAECDTVENMTVIWQFCVVVSNFLEISGFLSRLIFFSFETVSLLICSPTSLSVWSAPVVIIP